MFQHCSPGGSTRQFAQSFYCECRNCNRGEHVAICIAYLVQLVLFVRPPGQTDRRRNNVVNVSVHSNL